MVIDQTIKGYVERLVKAYPSIKSIWLFGSQANNSYRPDSDWDLLVFGNQQILDSPKNNNSFQDKRIDLMVVFNENEFEKPWPDNNEAKQGSLKSWEWVEITSELATYKSVKCKNEAEWFKEGMTICTTLKAFKIWPEDAAD